MYSTAIVVTDKLGYKGQSNRTSTQDTPSKKWKVRLQHRIVKWCVNFSCLKHLENGTLRNERTKATLTSKYHLESKTIKEVSEELKQSYGHSQEN